MFIRKLRIALFRFLFTRKLLRLLCGESFADEKFSLELLWKCAFVQKIIGINRNVPWPVHWTSQVKAPENIDRGSRMPGLALGCYIDGRSGIRIGENTWIGPGVKIVSQNHNLLSYDQYDESKPITIGRDCWLASNSIVLPGVKIGDHTVVAAGAVVTKSFPEGNQILAGVPAKQIRKLEPYRTEMQQANHTNLEESCR